MSGVKRLAGAVTALAVGLTGCAGGPVGPGELITKPGAEARAASGAFTAVIVEDDSQQPALLIPQIRDAEGQVVFTDSLQHTTRFGVGLVWEGQADALWILSSDHGHYRVTQLEGRWVKDAGGQPMPDEVARHASG